MKNGVRARAALACLLSVAAFAGGVLAFNGGGTKATAVALPITGPTNSFVGDNTGLSSLPSSGVQTWNNVTWWTWTPATTMAVGIRATSITPVRWDNTLEVWSGPTASTLVVQNDDSYGLDAQVTFTASAGVQYTIGMGGYTSSRTGTATLRMFEVPTAPILVTATAGNTTAAVSWTMAGADDQSVSSYQVTRYIGGVQDGSTSTVSGLPPATSLNVTGLVNGTAYTFRVRGVNIVGSGTLSDPSPAVTPVGLPGAPASVSAVAGDTAATVTFAAPASDGGAAITSYTVTASPGGQTATGTSVAPLVVTGLTNGTPYTFTVRATNSVGLGPASAASTAVTPVAACSLAAATGFLPQARIAIPYSTRLSSTGATSAATYALASGALAPGLTLASDGTISGTPTALVSARFVVQVTEATCTANLSHTLNVAAARWLTTGADAGGNAHVRSFQALTTQAAGLLGSFVAEPVPFGGGVRVALGDINRDGFVDLITGAGTGMGPTVRVYSGSNGALLMAISAFEAGFTGGVFVAAGDVNGDGAADIVVGSGEGRTSLVRVFDGLTAQLLAVPVGEFAPYWSGFFGGVHVATGDVNGDGYADVITGAGPGGGPHVRIWSGAPGAALQELAGYLAYDSTFPGGVFVAAGDVNGDGYADVITGAGPGGGPHVRVRDIRNGVELQSFFAYGAGFVGGVRVASMDADDDGYADVITGAGPGGGPHVRVFSTGPSGVPSELASFFAYGAAFPGGVFVAAPTPLRRMAIDIAAPNPSVPGTVTIAGWALNETARANTTGVNAIHVWAYPVTGGAPSFAGAYIPNAERPDMAGAYGGQFQPGGFHFNTTPLPSGTYDLVIYALDSVGVVTQRIVRVSVP